MPGSVCRARLLPALTPRGGIRLLPRAHLARAGSMVAISTPRCTSTSMRNRVMMCPCPAGQPRITAWRRANTCRHSRPGCARWRRLRRVTPSPPPRHRTWGGRRRHEASAHPRIHDAQSWSATSTAGYCRICLRCSPTCRGRSVCPAAPDPRRTAPRPRGVHCAGECAKLPGQPVQPAPSRRMP
jgi:hypothetical protein